MLRTYIIALIIWAAGPYNACFIMQLRCIIVVFICSAAALHIVLRINISLYSAAAQRYIVAVIMLRSSII